MEFLRRDLEGCVTSKYRDRGAPTKGISFGSTEEEEMGVFDQRYFIPFEHNRRAGVIFPDRASTDGEETALERSVMNAQKSAEGESYHENFDAIAFASRSNLSRQVHSIIERGVLSFGAGTEHDRRFRNSGEVCLAAFYCAYTYDSALEKSGGSMKLFRHFRDSGGSMTASRGEVDAIWERHLQSRARSLVFKLADNMVPILEAGGRDNADLPYLLMPVDQYRGRAEGSSSWYPAMHIWPVNPVEPLLAEVPPEAMPDQRTYFDGDNWQEFVEDDNYVWPD